MKIISEPQKIINKISMYLSTENSLNRSVVSKKDLLKLFCEMGDKLSNRELKLVFVYSCFDTILLSNWFEI